ncbi:hypothetical protein LZ554_001409 [Drepanopeziza brunnea f. sp. 'monogermtubi']|nr:hypothetical protein LZ554_001409 [Drepanopeziza brunnea f. sp. 'monogermtubi']
MPKKTSLASPHSALPVYFFGNWIPLHTSILGPLLPIPQFEVKRLQQLHEHEFGIDSGKEASGTGVLPSSRGQVRAVEGGDLVLGGRWRPVES